LSRNGLRIAWADDLQKNKGVKDITDLLNTIRNAACHLDSPKNYLEDTKTKFVFNTFFGKKHNALEIGQNVFLGCDFEDDVGFYYGENRIYLRRHIVRLLQELPKEINKLQV
jgi:hypothetical protein